jgi:hypothetical protein
VQDSSATGTTVALKGLGNRFLNPYFGDVNMAAITIRDLPQDRELDRNALASMRGAAGAPFVYGWIQPYLPPQPAAVFPAMSFYQINNINNTSVFYAEQVTNQFQTVEITNSAPSANITTVLIGSQSVA